MFIQLIFTFYKRQQWHLIPLPTRAGRWQMVWQGPRLGWVAETGRFVAMETPWVWFSCLLALVPCFLLFVFPFAFLIFFRHPGMYCLFRVPSSVQQTSATLSEYVFYSTRSICLCHLHPTPSRNSLFFIRLVFVFVARISRVASFRGVTNL